MSFGGEPVFVSAGGVVTAGFVVVVGGVVTAGLVGTVGLTILGGVGGGGGVTAGLVVAGGVTTLGGGGGGGATTFGGGGGATTLGGGGGCVTFGGGVLDCPPLLSWSALARRRASSSAFCAGVSVVVPWASSMRRDVPPSASAPAGVRAMEVAAANVPASSKRVSEIDMRGLSRGTHHPASAAYDIFENMPPEPGIMSCTTICGTAEAETEALHRKHLPAKRIGAEE